MSAIVPALLTVGAVAAAGGVLAVLHANDPAKYGPAGGLGNLANAAYLVSRAGSRTGVSARVRSSVPMRLGEAVAQFVVGEQGGAAVGVVDGRDLEVEAFRGVIDRHRGLLGGLRRLAVGGSCGCRCVRIPRPGARCRRTGRC